MAKEKFTVDISIDQLKIRLGKMMSGAALEHGQFTANLIIDILAETDAGLPKLFLAMTGINPRCKFKVGQQVYVPFKSMPSWRMNREKMEESDLIIQDHCMGMILEINEARSDSVKIQYTYIGDDEKSVLDSYYFEPKTLLEYHEDTFIEKLEIPTMNVIPPIKDELPF